MEINQAQKENKLEGKNKVRNIKKKLEGAQRNID